MIKYFTLTFVVFYITLLAFESLPDKYLIQYGNPEAKVKITSYFSFLCPHCVQNFRTDFREVKEKYLDSGKVFWTFHPVPMDLLTIRAMDCLSNLKEREKKVFLEATLLEIDIEDIDYSFLLLGRALKIMGVEDDGIKDPADLENSLAYKDAFHFMVQEPPVDVLPLLEINGRLYEGKAANMTFLQKEIECFEEEND